MAVYDERHGNGRPVSDGTENIYLQTSVSPENSRALKDAMLIGALAVSAKFFAATREVVIAWRYGVSGIVDAFNISYTVVTWAPQLITSIMITALVPHLVYGAGSSDSRLVKAELNGAVLSIALVALFLTAIMGPWIAVQVSEGLDPTTVATSRSMTFLLAPFSFLMIFSGYFAVRLQARQRFGYTFFEALPPLLLSVFVLAISNTETFLPLVGGILAGGVLQFILCVWLIRKHDEGLTALRFGFTAPIWPPMLMALGLIALGQTFNAISIPLDQILAANLGTGAVAMIGYSNRLIGLVTSLAIVVIGYSLLPLFSAKVASGRIREGRDQAVKAAALLFIAGVALSVLVWLFARWGVAIVFERGAFNSQDTQTVSSIFRISALQIPFFASGIALLQWLAATKRHGKICIVLMIMAGGKLFSAQILSKLLGLPGIAWSQVAMYVILALGMGLFVLADDGNVER